MKTKYLMQALDEIKQKKQSNEENFEKSLKKLQKNSDFKEIYCKICNLKFEIAKCEFENRDCDCEKKQLSDLVLKAKKMWPDFSASATSTCKMCNDEGLVDGKFCVCTTNRAKQIAKQEGGIDNSIKISEVDKEFYDDEQTQKLVLFLRSWSDRFENVGKKNILLMGKTGVGKSFLAKAVACEIFEKGFDVVCVNAFNLNEEFLKERTNFERSQNFLTKYIEPDLLIIDDLGVEPKYKNVTENYLYLLLSMRQDANKSTIITTNLQLAGIEEEYGQRNFSRICNKAITHIFQLSSCDLRLKA